MKTTKTGREQAQKVVWADFGGAWQKSWTYIRTVVDVVHEPVVILDKDLRVMAANEQFYQVFGVTMVETEQQIIYKLGNGQWDIPELRKLLSEVVSEGSFFKGLEVDHVFPRIGRKVMILNARQIYIQEHVAQEQFPPIILLAIEDVTEMVTVAKKLAEHTNNMEIKLAERTKRLEIHIEKLENKLNKMQKSAKGGASV